MKTITRMAVLLFGFSTSMAWADLTPFVDYDIGEEVMSVTTVKVKVNSIDQYLEGIRDTWVHTNNIAKELGHIKDYGIYVSQLPGSGDFNVVLTVTMANAGALQPSKEKFDAFMKKWGEKAADASEKISKSYPDIRVITGEYHLRRITMK